MIALVASANPVEATVDKISTLHTIVCQRLGNIGLRHLACYEVRPYEAEIFCIIFIGLLSSDNLNLFV